MQSQHRAPAEERTTGRGTRQIRRSSRCEHRAEPGCKTGFVAFWSWNLRCDRQTILNMDAAWPPEPGAAIQHIRRHTSCGKDPVILYEVLSDSVYWSDEMTPDIRLGIQGVLMLLAHRRRIAERGGSDYVAWWNFARAECPEWTGFRAERQQFDAHVSTILHDARIRTQKQWEKYLGPPDLRS